MATATLASLEALRSELVNSKYYLNIRSGYMAPVTLHCSYGDSGETITFYIFDGGQAFNLAGSTVSLHGTRRDGANFGPFSCTVSGNSVSFQLQSSMTAVEGGGIAEFTITKSGTTVGTCNFGILVENATFPNGVAYDTDPSVYQDILKYVQRSTNSLTNTINSVNSSLTNSITEVNARIDTIVAQAGDDNTEIVDARTAYDGTAYTTLGEHVRTVDTDFNNRINKITHGLNAFSYQILNSDVSNGAPIGNVGDTISFGTQDYWQHGFYAVIPGKHYSVTTRCNTKNDAHVYHIWWINSNNVILKHELDSATLGETNSATLVENYDVVAPDKAEWLVVVTYASTYANVVKVYENSFNYSLGIVDKLLGKVSYTEKDISLTYTTGCVNNGLQAKIGSVIAFDTRTYWGHSIVYVKSGEIYKFNTSVNKYIGGKAVFIHWLDEGNVIVDAEFVYDGSKNDSSVVTRQHLNDYIAFVPKGACKMCVLAMLDESSYTSGNIKLSKIEFNSLSDQISRIENPANSLPSYYNSRGWWDAKISAINTANSEILNGISFAFITDLHFPYNTLNSKYMLADILVKTEVPFCICGGDFPQAYGNEDSLRESANELLEYQRYIGKDRFFTIRGNHDFTIKTDSSQTTGAAGSGVTLPTAFTYNAIGRNQECYVVGSDPNDMAWYIDIPGQKTRLVGLNSCNTQGTDATASWAVHYRIIQSQVDWLLNEALSKEGYRYIFFSHIPADPELDSYNNSQDVFHQIFVAMKNKTSFSYSGTYVTAAHDFTNTTSTAICHICGHCHTDDSNKDNNFLSITTTCDAHYNDDGYGATVGTITEQAFDVFFVDYDKGTINAIRCGRGSNRSWTY